MTSLNCHKCERTFRRYRELCKHIDIQHPTMTLLNCPKCERTFKTNRKLYKHIDIQHPRKYNIVSNSSLEPKTLEKDS
jgi:uncharacterized C2H2 Zn-finger protein